MCVAEKSAIEEAKRCKTDEHDSEDEEDKEDDVITDGSPEDEAFEGMKRQTFTVLWRGDHVEILQRVIQFGGGEVQVKCYFDVEWTIGSKQ